MIYYFIIILIFVLGYFCPRKPYCVIVCVILVLFAGLRANIVGPDTTMYKYLYEAMEGHNFMSLWTDYMDSGTKDLGRIEIGYWFLSYLFSRFAGYDLFKFFCSAVAVIPACILIYRYSQKASISFFNFFALHVYTMMSMSMMRQGLAFGVSIIAIMYLIENRFRLFFLFVAIACLFHMSAVFIFPVYFLYKFPYKRKYNLWIIIAVLIVFISSSTIFEFLIQYSRVSYEAGESGGFGMLGFLSLLFFSSFFINEKYFSDRLNSFLLYLLVYTLILWAIGMNLAAIFRLAAYSEFFICLYITNIVPKIENKLLRYLAMACFILLSFLVMQQVVLQERETYGYLPFYFLWQV